jgi:hypothetical protein
MMSLREEMNLNMSLPDRIDLPGHTHGNHALAKIGPIVSEKTAAGT